MRSTKRFVLDFISVDKFRSWERFRQWRYVDAKRDLATKIISKEYSTGNVTQDKILWRKLNRHIKFYEREIRRQDKLNYMDRMALFRAQHHPCQTSLETFFYSSLQPKVVNRKDK